MNDALSASGEPSTEAGRALLDLDLDRLPEASDRAKQLFGRQWDMRAAILAIEREARATPPALDALTVAIRSSLDWRHGETVVVGHGNAEEFAAHILARLSTGDTEPEDES
jgi:hypothetical protein